MTSITRRQRLERLCQLYDEYWLEFRANAQHWPESEDEDVQPLILGFFEEVLVSLPYKALAKDDLSTMFETALKNVIGK